MIETTPEDLARAVATQFSSDVSFEMEAELKREKTRAFGQQIVDAATVGAFIAQVAQLAVQIHIIHRSRPELISTLDARTASAAKIPADKRRSIIGHIVDRLTGSST